MKQPVSGYHKDDEDHWVAQLACGHFQHVRHDPPMSSREWTQTKEGRDTMIGFELNCVKCEEGTPRDQVPASADSTRKTFETNRTGTILYCQRWSETVHFYRDLLRLDISFENSWFVEFQLNTTTFLSVANSDQASIDAVDGQGITLSWQTPDINKVRSELTSLGIETTPVQSKWNARLFYFHDPEGHRIELWQPTESSSTTDCDLETSVPNWLIEHPELLPLFKELRIDYCCGGKSLETACREQKLEPQKILVKIRQLLRQDLTND